MRAATPHAVRIREYVAVWQRDGLDAFLDLVPDDVEFLPYSANGRRLWGKGPIRDFWQEVAARGERVEVDIADIEALDEDNVMVTGTLTRRGNGATSVDQIAWLYSFRDGQLSRASGHASASEAREVARFLHRERVERPGDGPFRVTLREKAGGSTVLRPAGELDLASAENLAAAVARAAPSGHVVVDLAGLDFLDSSGLRVLLAASRTAECEGWRLELRRPSAAVRRVFDLAGVTELLPVADGEPIA